MQLALAAIVVALVARKIVAEWGAVELALAEARPNWLALAASGVVVLATYAVLIETWRVILRGWQHEIPFLDAARIWTISNLGKYLPGKVWSITALAVMSREYGVSAAEGATASVLRHAHQHASSASRWRSSRARRCCDFRPSRWSSSR